MFLSIENVGKVKTAEIEISGITVIAGENNTGKSTLGEVLFSVFNSFHNPEERIYEDRCQSVYQVLRKLQYEDIRREHVILDPASIRFLTERLVSERQLNKTIADIQNILINTIYSESEADNEFNENLLEEIKLTAKQIYERLAVSDEDFFNEVLNSNLNEEFNGQVNNIYNNQPAYIGLTIKGTKTEIVVSDDKVESISDILHLSTEAVYLDDPFILDDAFALPSRSLGHRNQARRNIRKRLMSDNRFRDIESDGMQDSDLNSTQDNTFNYIVVSGKLQEIYNKIDKVCGGRIVRNSSRRGVGYAVSGSDKILDVKNLSSGLKTFAIIKQFLLNGIIEENGTLILDEPEIHLHPEWQLLFAELIVMLQREFGLHILLNTHSPYFFNAIQVYAQKYDVADKCKYYQAVAEGNEAIVLDVTDNTELIYEKLAAPFQTLENEVFDG